MFFESKKVGVYTPDFVVEDKIFIEIKAKPFIARQDIIQFWHYLTSSNYKLGFLINFGRAGGVQLVRKVYDKAREKTRKNAEFSGGISQNGAEFNSEKR